jgi:uncharacterized protein YbjT (DUF2867 family)
MQLLADNARAGRVDVLGAARSSGSSDRLRAGGFTPVTFDYDAPETLRPALEGVDAVFLITGYTVDMLVHSKRLLDAAKAAGVRHIVHLGALAPDDTPHAHFAWHQLIERAIESIGFSFTHLRPNFFMNTVWAGLRHRPDRVVHFVGDHRVSWISAQDIAAVAVEALRDPEAHGGNTYPLAVEALSFAEIAAVLSDVMGHEVVYRPRSASELLPILLKQGMDPAYAASLAGGIAAIEAGRMPLVDAVYPTVETITGRTGISWREFAEERKEDLFRV